MADLTESLLRAYENADSSTFSGICARLDASEHERQTTAERLLEIACEGDTRQAELAVNCLRFTGIALQTPWYERLIGVGEKIFTLEVLSRLAERDARGLGGVRRKLSPELRLLRSIISALVRKKDEPRATAFLEAVESRLAGTDLGARVTKWKQGSQ